MVFTPYSSTLPPSTWRLHTGHLLYPARIAPEPVVIYSRAGTAEVISDRAVGRVLDAWA